MLLSKMKKKYLLFYANFYLPCFRDKEVVLPTEIWRHCDFSARGRFIQDFCSIILHTLVFFLEEQLVIRPIDHKSISIEILYPRERIVISMPFFCSVFNRWKHWLEAVRRNSADKDVSKAFDIPGKSFIFVSRTCSWLHVHRCYNMRITLIGLVWFILRPCQQTVGHRFKSTSTNELRFTAPGLPWWSPIQVLTEVDVWTSVKVPLIIYYVRCTHASWTVSTSFHNNTHTFHILENLHLPSDMWS